MSNWITQKSRGQKIKKGTRVQTRVTNRITTLGDQADNGEESLGRVGRWNFQMERKGGGRSQSLETESIYKHQNIKKKQNRR